MHTKTAHKPVLLCFLNEWFITEQFIAIFNLAELYRLDRNLQIHSFHTPVCPSEHLPACCCNVLLYYWFPWSTLVPYYTTLALYFCTIWSNRKRKHFKPNYFHYPNCKAAWLSEHRPKRSWINFRQLMFLAT